MNKKILVTGGNGLIGHHMSRRLKEQGHHVTVADIKRYEFGENDYSDYEIIGDLTRGATWNIILRKHYDEAYIFAALIGGCQYIFTGGNDADIMYNNAKINLNACEAFKKSNTKVFLSSSACMYPENIQSSEDSVALKEESGKILAPDSLYGLEKGFAERLYMAFNRNYGMDIRIARFHNIYGTESTYKGGKEKAPSSISRKVAEAKDKVQIWGTGEQRRSFLYVDDCIDAVQLLMESDYKEPINIGSDKAVTINELWETAIRISGKNLKIEHIERPENTLGVLNRNSDNTLVRKVLGWEQKIDLEEGIRRTYNWINQQINP